MNSSVLQVERILEGLEVPEGPVVTPDGGVLFTEIMAGTVSRYVPGRVRPEHVATCGGGPNGAALVSDTQLLVANNGGRSWVDHGGGMHLPASPQMTSGLGGIQAIDLHTGTVEYLYREGDNLPQSCSPNDLVLDGMGGLYFTDYGRNRSSCMDYGSIFYAATDGSSAVQVATGLTKPNGCGLSLDGQRFYVSETLTGRVWWWDVLSPGQLSGGQTFHGSGGGNLLYGAPSYRMFDSMAIDEQDAICVATFFDVGVSRISVEGNVTEFLIDDRVITNLCFDAGYGHVYLTAAGSGSLLRAAWPKY